MEKMTLGKSYIERTENHVRLCTDIVRKGESFKLFFEFSPVYEKYLCTEVADPFLTAILPYAMEFGYDIECSGKISFDIFYNYTNEIIPTFARLLSFAKPCRIEAKEGLSFEEIKTENAVGTGVSCGVDSLYTILSHYYRTEDSSLARVNTNSGGGDCDNRCDVYKNLNILGCKSYNLTHLVLMNAGACSYKGGEESYKWFTDEAEMAKKVCDELGLELITIHTNLMEFYGIDHTHSGTMRMAGCVMALSKLFGKYYLASGYPVDDFKFLERDDAFYAFYTLNYTSTKNLKFMLEGNYCDRDQRIKFIADSEISKKYLNVCWNGFHNCSRCEKCLRTMGSLYSIGKLGEYGTVFDVNDFEKHKVLRIAEMMYNRKTHVEFYGFMALIRKQERALWNKSRLIYIFRVKPYNFIKNLFKAIVKPDSAFYKKCKNVFGK